jgi:hypothetical protein
VFANALKDGQGRNGTVGNYLPFLYMGTITPTTKKIHLTQSSLLSFCRPFIVLFCAASLYITKSCCGKNAEASENSHIFQLESFFQRLVTHSSCYNQGQSLLSGCKQFQYSSFQSFRLAVAAIY